MRRTLCFSFVIITVVLFCAGCDNSHSTPSIGEEGVIDAEGQGYISGARDEASFDEMTSAQVAKDKLGELNLAAQGQAAILDRGTRVKVIDAKWAKVRVRVLSGTYFGDAFWVSADCVHKRPSMDTAPSTTENASSRPNNKEASKTHTYTKSEYQDGHGTIYERTEGPMEFRWEFTFPTEADLRHDPTIPKDEFTFSYHAVNRDMKNYRGDDIVKQVSAAGEFVVLTVHPSHFAGILKLLREYADLETHDNYLKDAPVQTVDLGFLPGYPYGLGQGFGYKFHAELLVNCKKLGIDGNDNHPNLHQTAFPYDTYDTLNEESVTLLATCVGDYSNRIVSAIAAEIKPPRPKKRPRNSSDP